ncbi:hypothetical protein ACFLZI_02330 [Nitrospirota bacterium]
MTLWRRYIAVVLGLTLCAPSVALSREGDESISASFGYNRVEGANSYTLELDFTTGQFFYGGGLFIIDNGNLPGNLRDNPPSPGVNTIDVGKFNSNESGAYLKGGIVRSGFRAFVMLGFSAVNDKYVVKSTLSDIHYVTEEETGNGYGLYGGGIGYLIADKVLLQYQHDNRRKNLFLVGLSF